MADGRVLLYHWALSIANGLYLLERIRYLKSHMIFSYPGVTPPLAIAPPTDHELAMSGLLEEAMKPHGVFESDADLSHRYVSVDGAFDATIVVLSFAPILSIRLIVLDTVNKLVKEWIMEVSISKVREVPSIYCTVCGT